MPRCWRPCCRCGSSARRCTSSRSRPGTWLGSASTSRRRPSRDGFPTVRGVLAGRGRRRHRRSRGRRSPAARRRRRTCAASGRSASWRARTRPPPHARRSAAFPSPTSATGPRPPTTIRLIPVSFPWRILPLTCTLVVTAALVLTRRPGTRVARAFFLLAIAYGLHWTFFFGGPRLQTYAWVIVFFCASLVMLPLDPARGDGLSRPRSHRRAAGCRGGRGCSRSSARSR